MLREQLVRTMSLGLAMVVVACTGQQAPSPAASSPTASSPTISASSSADANATAFIRVNQAGYAANASKRAYLMSRVPETGATFTVSASGITFSSGVGADLGSWSGTFKHVYPIEFSALKTPGSYTISVGGPAAATSPQFIIADAGNIYAADITNALSFYQVQRDGPNFIPSALRTAPGHLNDRHAMTYLTPPIDPNSGEFKGNLIPLGTRIDASGGWWDAGDYPKFVETTSYTVAVLLAGLRDFPQQMGAGSPSDFTAESKFGVDFLLKMWNDRTRTLYYQVGIGSGNSNTLGDHDIWRLPQLDDKYGGHKKDSRYIRHRPVFRAGPPGSKISPNLAGRLAAAFAECYQVFRTSDPALAKRCLLSAEHIFALADTSPTGQLLTVAPWDFYPESEWRDDMELGATELYRALAADTDRKGLPQKAPLYYGRQAASWARAYIHGPNDARDPLNLYDVSGLAHYELLSAAGSLPTGSAVTKAQLLADLRKQLERAVALGKKDPFGFGFPWNTWDTTSHGAGLSVMAGEYDRLTGTDRYSVYADRWLANILGANAWGLSLIVGDGSNFPHCLQHQVANLVGSLDGNTPVLAGAAVEGPNSAGDSGSVDGMKPCPADGVDGYALFNGHGAEFIDNMESYPNTEPAIDLTATSPLAFAWLESRG
jgi:endoglucanase